MDREMLNEFLAEAEEMIESLFSDVQALRERRAEGRARRELIGRIFRRIHTIKGSSATTGLDTISKIAHELETLLDAVRNGKIAVTDAALDAFDRALDEIARGIRATARGEKSSMPDALIEDLRQLATSDDQRPRTDPRHISSVALPDDLVSVLSEYEINRLLEAAREGSNLYEVFVNFDMAAFDEDFRRLSDVLTENGEIISTLPSTDESAPTGSLNFRIIYATDETEDLLISRSATFNAKLKTISTKAETESERSDETPTPEIKAATNTHEVEAAPSTTRTGPVSSANALTMLLVRVPLDGLDDLISATHEIFTDTIGALDLALASNLSRSERTEMEIRAARIRRRFLELEERLIELRMVPMDQTLERAARAGQSAARVSQREVEIETSGNDVRLDKSVADRIADPLLHLLRNAVDHGIEPSEERIRAGKSGCGRVRLEALSEGSRVIVRVSDDGRGIDPEHIKRSAVSRGIIAPESQMSEQECLRLIFRPGFSTAKEVSSISGRGVGLDVVERTVEEIGGELRVRSKPADGTTFEMRLPTTLALVPSLIVCSDGNRYCIDASHIIEAGYITPDAIERNGDALMVRWRDQLIPMVHIRDLLAQPSPEKVDEPRIHIIISRLTESETETEDDEDSSRKAAIIVDRWDGHHEVLVRGLGRHATHWKGVTGATELLNGQVALVLDLPRLLEMYL